MDSTDLLFFVLALLCEIVGTISGFGSSLLFVPLAGMFYAHQEVLLLTALLHVFSNTSKLFFFWKYIRWHLVWRFIVPAVLFTILGAWLSKFVEVTVAHLFLGSFLILFSLFLMMWPAFELRRSVRNILVTAGLSGFIAGIVGTGGAIRGLGLLAFQLEKDLFVGTSAAIDFGVDASRLWVYFVNGFRVDDALLLVIALIVISIVGTYLGKIVLEKIATVLFRKIVLVLILAMGVLLLFQAFAASNN